MNTTNKYSYTGYGLYYYFFLALAVSLFAVGTIKIVSALIVGVMSALWIYKYVYANAVIKWYSNRYHQIGFKYKAPLMMTVLKISVLLLGLFSFFYSSYIIHRFAPYWVNLLAIVLIVIACFPIVGLIEHGLDEMDKKNYDVAIIPWLHGEYLAVKDYMDREVGESSDRAELFYYLEENTKMMLTREITEIEWSDRNIELWNNLK